MYRQEFQAGVQDSGYSHLWCGQWQNRGSLTAECTQEETRQCSDNHWQLSTGILFICEMDINQWIIFFINCNCIEMFSFKYTVNQLLFLDDFTS